MQLQHTGNDCYCYILGFLRIPDLGRLAQTNINNRDRSSHDLVWMSIFIRDFGSTSVYQAEKLVTVRNHFKSAYRDLRNILPIIHAKDVYELCQQMILLSHLFTKPRLEHKRQYRCVWYKASKDGAEITRQNGVRDTYIKVRCRNSQDHDGEIRTLKKARTLQLPAGETFGDEENDPFAVFR